MLARHEREEGGSMEKAAGPKIDPAQIENKALAYTRAEVIHKDEKKDFLKGLSLSGVPWLSWLLLAVGCGVFFPTGLILVALLIFLPLASNIWFIDHGFLDRPRKGPRKPHILGEWKVEGFNCLSYSLLENGPRGSTILWKQTVNCDNYERIAEIEAEGREAKEEWEGIWEKKFERCKALVNVEKGGSPYLPLEY